MRPCFQEYTVLLTLLAAATSQAQTDSPAFEVASIKPNRSASGHSSSHGSKGQIVMENVSLKQLIERAWDVRDFSISGPGWLDAEHFDIMAKIPPGSTKEQLLPMLRSLLEHRFKVAVHFETKKLSGYALERENERKKRPHSLSPPTTRSQAPHPADAENCRQPVLWP